MEAHKESEGSTPDPKAHLMEEVAAQMDAIEADFGDDFVIGRVVTIVEVRTPDGETNLRIRAAMEPWAALGMTTMALKSMGG